MLSKKKKIFILAGMVVLLVVTGYVNVLLNNKAKEADSAGVQAGNFFSNYRTERTATRDQTFLYLTSIIESATSSDEAKALAEQQQDALTRTMTLENALEGIIKGLGFEDCVVSAATENINVIVKKSDLNEQEMIQILSVVVNESGKEPKNIKIIPV